MTHRPLILVGTRQNMELILEIAELNGHNVVGILDRFYLGHSFEGIPVIGSDLDLADPDDSMQQIIDTHDFFVATVVTGASRAVDPGANTILLKQQRMQLVRAAGCNLVNLIHPMAHVSATANLGQNILIARYAYIEAHVTVGDFCTLMYNVGIGHNSVLGENCSLQGDSGMVGNTRLGNNVVLGINTRLLNTVSGSITVGNNVMFGPSLTVMKDIPDNVIVYPNGKMVTTEEFFPLDYYSAGIVAGYKKLT